MFRKLVSVCPFLLQNSYAYSVILVLRVKLGEISAKVIISFRECEDEFRFSRKLRLEFLPLHCDRSQA